MFEYVTLLTNPNVCWFEWQATLISCCTPGAVAAPGIGVWGVGVCGNEYDGNANTKETQLQKDVDAKKTLT